MTCYYQKSRGLGVVRLFGQAGSMGSLLSCNENAVGRRLR